LKEAFQKDMSKRKAAESVNEPEGEEKHRWRWKDAVSRALSSQGPKWKPLLTTKSYAFLRSQCSSGPGPEAQFMPGRFASFLLHAWLTLGTLHAMIARPLVAGGELPNTANPRTTRDEDLVKLTMPHCSCEHEDDKDHRVVKTNAFQLGEGVTLEDLQEEYM
jgi:hypothetical protein